MLSAFSSLSHGGQTFGTEETEQTHYSILKGYDPTTDRMCCNCPYVSDQYACWCECSVMVQTLHLKLWSSIAALLCSSGTVVRADLLYWEYTAQLCPAVTQYNMFLFWLLYILLVQARSVRCRKVNAAATAAEHGEKWFSALTQAALRASHTLWNDSGKPKQQVTFIFNLQFMVMPALLWSMFGLTVL